MTACCFNVMTSPVCFLCDMNDVNLNKICNPSVCEFFRSLLHLKSDLDLVLLSDTFFLRGWYTVKNGHEFNGKRL